MKKKKHPMQPIVMDRVGVIRFLGNPIVEFLLDWASNKGMSLNDLVLIGRGPQKNGWTPDDWAQFYQLLGTSVSGFGSISYLPTPIIQKADAKCAALQLKLPKSTAPVDSDD